MRFSDESSNISSERSRSSRSSNTNDIVNEVIHSGLNASTIDEIHNYYRNYRELPSEAQIQEWEEENETKSDVETSPEVIYNVYTSPTGVANLQLSQEYARGFKKKHRRHKNHKKINKTNKKINKTNKKINKINKKIHKKTYRKSHKKTYRK